MQAIRLRRNVVSNLCLFCYVMLSLFCSQTLRVDCREEEAMPRYDDVTSDKGDVHVFARVRLSVWLSVC